MSVQRNFKEALTAKYAGVFLLTVLAAGGFSLTAGTAGAGRHSLLFDGENYVHLPHGSEIIGDEPEALSVSFWVKFFSFDQTAYLAGGNNGRPFDLWVRAGGRRMDLRIRGYNIDGGITDSRIQARGTELTQAAPRETEEVDPRWLGVPDETEDVWHHVCFTCCFKTGEVSLYLDGEIIASRDGVQVVRPVNRPLAIGRSHRHAGLKNQQDDVRIYRRVLSPSEVEKLYGGEPVDEKGVAGHWKLDEGEGDTAHDSSGNGHHGILGPEDNRPLWREDSALAAD